jgi:microcin C transport system substrate-binding protein
VIRSPLLSPTRRTLLRAAAASAAAPLVSGTPVSAAAPGAGETETHGLSVFGDLALPPDFKHLPYVNPGAPKGGEIKLQVSSTSGNMNFTTFNTLNDFILAGDGAAGMDLVFDTLMASNADEPDSMYGLVARAVRVSDDRHVFRFLLRKEARFHDGSPLTAKDVAFSLKILQEKGHPSIRQALRDLDSATAEPDGTLLIRLKPTHSREAILTVASQPIFSAAYYGSHAFDATTLEPPLGSGPYKVGPFEVGRYIAFQRVPDYWGRDLPIAVGSANFDSVRYEYFADRKVAFEAFKAGVFTYREEFTSAVWATGYDFAAVNDGRVKRETLPDNTPNGTQAWYMNTRRAKFANPVIRAALAYAFDFTWTNANLMYGVYQRTVSYFQNSPMAATGTPSPAELAILDAYRGKVSDAVFGEVYTPPLSDGSGMDRKLMRQANTMLQAAGCRRQDSTLLLPDGTPFDIEFLDFEGSLQPHTMAFINNLKALGINAVYRVVDSSQYKRRTDNFDYDIVTSRSSFGLTPGEKMRQVFGSEAAKIPGSQNLAGIADPVIDALVAKALVAETREQLTIDCKCIDRVLRAGHYWIPMWNKATHLIAYWDLFDRPKQEPRYGLGVLGTWWYDGTKAKRVDLAGH